MALFGRERELEVLRAALSRGSGALLRISGEPGVGKTALADAAFELARARGHRAGWARAWRGAPAYEPLRAALRDAGVTPAPGPSREATFEAARRALATLGPALVVVDDVHEADSDSLDLLAWLGPQLRSSSALVLVTERSASAGADAVIQGRLAKLARASATLELGPLTSAAVGELIAMATGRPPDERFVEAVHRGTGGNALFVDGIVRAALRDGTLASGTLRFPRDVEQAIAERVDDAGPDVAGVLRVAAVVGRPVPPGLVASVLSRTLLEVTDLLARGCAEQLLVRQADGRFAFRHPLVGDAIAAGLDAASRAALHAAVARVLGDGAPPAEIARHQARAVPLVPAATAIAACQRAAEAAAMETAHEEDVQWRSAVVALLESGAGAGAAHDRAGAELELGRAILRAGRRDDARASLSRAAVAARSAGDAARLCEVAIAFADTGEFGAVDASKRALLREARAAGPVARELAIRVKARLGAELWAASATRAEADALTREAIAEARAAGEGALVFATLDARFQALWGPETLEERVALAGELAARARDTEDRVSVGRRRLLIAAELGDPVAFERELTTFAELAARLARPSLDETVLQRHLWLALVRGDLDAAERLTSELYELGMRIQNPQAEMGRRFALSAIALARGDGATLRTLVAGFADDVARLPNLPFIRARFAQLAARTGDDALAARELPRAVRDLEAARTGDLVTLAALAFGADAAALLGDRASAAKLRELLAPHRRLFATIGASIGVGAVAHALALVERTLDDPRAAESFREALAFHRAMDAPHLVAATEREMNVAVRGERAAAASPARRAALRLAGADAVLAWDGMEHRIRRSRGLELLAALLGRPGVPAHVLTLSGADELRGAGGARERTIDARARAAYASRLAELREQERWDPRVRREREALEDEVARAARPRATDEGERARVAVAKAVRRAIDALALVAPDAAEHLRRSVRTGYECAYDPAPEARIEWDVTM